MNRVRDIALQPSDEELLGSLPAYTATLPVVAKAGKPAQSGRARPSINGSTSKSMWKSEQVRQALQEISSGPLDHLDRDQRLSKLAWESGWSKTLLKRQLDSYLKRAPITKSGIPAIEAVTPELAAIAEVLGKSDLFSEFRKDLLALGYVASEQVAGSLFMSHGARLLDRSTGFIFHGASGSGKTDGMLTGARMLPPELVVNLTSITDRAMYYIGDIKGKYIIFGEVAPVKTGDDDPKQMAWRQLISENRLTLQSVERGEDGHNTAVLHTTEGPAVIVAATTTEQTAWNDEFVNRQSWVRSDDSVEATKQVCDLIAARAASPWTVCNTDAIGAKWQTLHRILEPLPVVIRFADLIKPTLPHVSVRRLFTLVLTYTRISALLYQAQREKMKIDGVKYLVADITDYERAYRLLQANAPRVLDAVSQPAAHALEKLRGTLESRSLTQGEIRAILGHPKTTVQRWIGELVDAGLMSVDSKKGRSYVYILGAGTATTVELGLVPPAQIMGDDQ